MARRDPAAAARAAMPERYGHPSRTGRVVGTLAAVAALGAGLVWFLGVAVDGSTPEVSAGVVAFDVVSDRRTDLTFEVRRVRELAVTCEVSAQAVDKAIVGERTVQLASAAEGSQQVTVSIATERRATTALVGSCYDSSFPP